MMRLRRAWPLARSCHGYTNRQASLANIYQRSFSGSERLSQASTSGNLAALKSILKVSEEVTDALATNRPVVALESTIYTHGALGNDLDLEGVVRRNGGVPAVVGILGGIPTVGLQPEEVTRMVEGSPKKVSRRDIAYLVGMVCFNPCNMSPPYLMRPFLVFKSEHIFLYRASLVRRSTEELPLLVPWF